MMKLIYFYLKRCHGTNFNLNINLSENKIIKINNDGKIEIENINSDIPIDFYGENISNITVIVGKNGTGKSSILNIIGLEQKDIYICYPDSQWIAIYENNETYYLEGFNTKDILNKYHIETNSKYISYKLKKENNNLNLDCFMKDDNGINNKHHIISTPNPSNNPEIARYLNRNSLDSKNYGFKRTYIRVNDAVYYEFITDNTDNFCSNLSKKHIKAQCISYNTEPSNNIRFYKETDRYKNIKNYNWDGIPFMKKKEKISNKKHLFIINLLEEYILTILNIIIDDEIKLSFIRKVKANPYTDILSNYSEIKKYLLNLINQLITELETIDDDSMEYINNKDIYYILNFLEHSNENKFIAGDEINNENIVLNIELKKYSDNTHEFISYLYKSIIPISFLLPEMSSGETDINHKIAGINSSIKQIINESENIKGFTLILDEYDEHLHPEWSRIFLSYLLKYLHERYNSYQFQIITSTHSPYIISDLLKENIIKIERDTKTGIYSSKKSTKGFASNIYDIINDSFFLSQPIGEFAINKINSVLNAINDNENKTPYKTLYSIINAIDDDHIRKILLNELNEKYHSDEELELELELDEIEHEIELLKNKKEKLLAKKESTHD